MWPQCQAVSFKCSARGIPRLSTSQVLASLLPPPLHPKMSTDHLGEYTRIGVFLWISRTFQILSNVNIYNRLFFFLHLGPQISCSDHIMVKFPSQCVLTAEAILRNQDLTEALQSGNLRQLFNLRSVRSLYVVFNQSLETQIRTKRCSPDFERLRLPTWQRWRKMKTIDIVAIQARARL